ncbi:MAG: hypothetical protein AB7D28_00525 [Candidatus Berkiella sp.]
MMKKIYASACLLCSLIFYINAVMAKSDMMNMTGLQYQGTINMIDIEAGTIEINKKFFALATPLKIVTTDKTIVNLSVLAAEQFVEFWIDNNAIKQNPELPYATIHQFRIISGINKQSITH